MNLTKLHNFNSLKLPILFCRQFANGQIVFNENKQSITNPSSKVSQTPNVQGLSSDVIKTSSEKLLPGTSKDGEYKNPEYFSYDKTSYFQAEIEMLRYRCPQPSALKK